MEQMGPERWAELMQRREEMIRAEKADPLQKGWEPPIWKVADALLGLERYGIGDGEWAGKCRDVLGFEAPIVALMINGGNRASKSEYAAKRTVQILMGKEERVGWCFQSTRENSIEMQQPTIYRYLPVHLRTEKPIKTRTTYISYSIKNGFSDDRFVLDNRSSGSFRNYCQDRETIEGGEVDVVWNDELVPPDWIETQMLRIATRDGVMIITFTPVEGYTQSVKEFQDGATVARESVAYLVPRDEEVPDYGRALVMEDCLQWVEGKLGYPEAPDGRDFEMTPRVMKCYLPQRACVFFFSSDNPFGNPKGVIKMVRGKGKEHTLERYYGKASKIVSSKFPQFDEEVHTIRREDIPAGGTNYLITDPRGNGNFAMIWWKAMQDGRFYVTREWPGSYVIPNVGVPGPWAVPDAKKLDGKPGKGQMSFGFGHVQYKEEIARLEGWAKYSEPIPEGMSRKEWIISWEDCGEAQERIFERQMDSRFGATVRPGEERPVTLMEEFENIGLVFKPTVGDSIDAGVTAIQAALDYNQEEEISGLNRPNLLICKDCKNTIFAMNTWTGADGQKGACKDWIDLIRYALEGDCIWVDEMATTEGYGGGHW